MSSLPGNIGLDKNILNIGSNILCKKNLNNKNNNGFNIINGTSGILVNVLFNQKNIIYKIKTVSVEQKNFWSQNNNNNNNNKKEKVYKICIYKKIESLASSTSYSSPICSNNNINSNNNSGGFGVCDNFIQLQIYDFDDRRVKLVNPLFMENICYSCANNVCNHNVNKINIIGFYFQSFYSSTLYNLQGITINSNVKLIFETSKVFGNNSKLRSLYVLLSRIEDKKSIICDKGLFIEALSIMFGKTIKSKINDL